MSEFAWGDLQLRRDASYTDSDNRYEEAMMAAPVHGTQWEWLLEGLDCRRILRTIMDFPVHEGLNPSNDILTDMNVNKESIHLHEDRYNPAFLVPLFLGVLQAFSLDVSSDADSSIIFEKCDESIIRKSPSSQNGSESVVDDQRETFVLVAQKLCTKGALSLALASLSGTCHGLRQTSVGVICLLLQAMQMREAHALVTWKERPQLEMILNSVQRGLLLDIMGHSDTCGSHSSENTVPILPNLSSIFLAKAAFIMSTPTDDLYPAINKFFLRLNSQHGAYTDCHSLPAFMSLFCNSSDDITQAKKERIWAIQLVKEGIVDSVCLDVIVKKHIPELLMTTFDSLSTRISSDKEVECNLILDAMSSIFDRGSSDALPTLINKLGLFPWILQIATKLMALKLHTLQWKFLHFAETCILSYSKFSDPNQIDSKTNCLVNIARLVVSSCVYYNENVSPETNDITGDILITVSSIFDKYRLEHIENFSNDDFPGLCLLSCVKFLDKCKSHEITRNCQLAHSICVLPLDIHNRDPAITYDFIKIVLTLLSNIPYDQVNELNEAGKEGRPLEK